MMTKNRNMRTATNMLNLLQVLVLATFSTITCVNFVLQLLLYSWYKNYLTHSGKKLFLVCSL